MGSDTIFIKIQRGRRITIPKRFANLLKIQPGDAVRMRLARGGFTMARIPAPPSVSVSTHKKKPATGVAGKK
jgi:bifunctional DNA-binding transcriptional regulator/antitoxin component of YhaV-PrlF toxin-antitoxin module